MLTKIFGSKNQREIKKLSKVVDRINAFLRQKTTEKVDLGTSTAALIELLK